MDQNWKTSLNELRGKEVLINGTVLTEDGGRFKVHLVVMAEMSPYLRHVISSTKEFTDGNILIKGCSKYVMGNIIDYMYTGHLEIDNVNALAETGHLLEMPDVIRLCEEYLMSKIDNDNCVRICTFVENFKCKDLKDVVQSYLLQNFHKIFPASDDYSNLQAEDPEDILSNENLNVKSEEYIFLTMMRWVESDPDTRVAYLPQLLKCLRFGLMSPEFCAINIWPNRFLASNEVCQIVIDRASQTLEDLTTKEDLLNESNKDFTMGVRRLFCRPRITKDIIFVMGGIRSESSVTNEIETYDYKSKKLFQSLVTRTSSPCITPICHHGMVWYQSHIYVIGGSDGVTILKTMQRYDPVHDVWEDMGSMQEMGGYDGQNGRPSCERFYPTTNHWQMVVASVRNGASAGYVHGWVYIACGFDGRYILRWIELYDPTTDVWDFINVTMVCPRSDHKMIAYNDRLYAIGGFDGTDRLASVEKFDPENNVIAVQPMIEPKSNFAAAVVDDCLYGLGDEMETETETVSTVECYGPPIGTVDPSAGTEPEPVSSRGMHCVENLQRIHVHVNGKCAQSLR